MNVGRIVGMGVLWGVATAWAAEPGVEFSAVLTADGQTRIALTDKSDRATRWVTPGETYRGYEVLRYDAKGEAVFLRHEGEEIRLPLASVRTPSPPAADVVDATVAARIRANLRLFANAARQYLAARGVAAVTYPDLVGPGKLLRELPAVAGENYTTLTYAPNASLSVTTRDGLLITYDPAPIAAVAAAPQPPAESPLPSAPSAPASAASTPPASGDALAPTGRAEAPASYSPQAAESLAQIAERTGVSVERLRALNPSLGAATTVPEGQTLRLR